MEIRYTGNETVDKLYGVEITGSVIPSIWYSKILNESGKPDTVAINLLADIVYWYRPTEEHNEFDPDVITLKKKFSVDKLQLGYEQIRKKVIIIPVFWNTFKFKSTKKLFQTPCAVFYLQPFI